MWSNVEHDAQESAKWLMLVLVWLLLASWRRLAVCVGPFIPKTMVDIYIYVCGYGVFFLACLTRQFQIVSAHQGSMMGYVALLPSTRRPLHKKENL